LNLILRRLVLLLVIIFSACGTNKPVKMLPVIEGPWWVIAPEPDLTELGLQPTRGNVQPNQPNDHYIFQTDDGKWHLWACVRLTAVGRILAHWEADSLTQSPWYWTGEIIRADKKAGESLIDWYNQEFIQSPFVVKNNETFFMVYGGYDTGLNPEGKPVNPARNYNSAEKQICLMTSTDGREWVRHQNEQGFSRIFMGPGAARDPCIIRSGERWLIYYCGHHNWDRTCGAIYVRTSIDLIHWSDWKIAHYDKNSEHKSWLPESPAVVFRKGYYYLFRTHGPEGGTYIFRSRDPFNFGQGDVSDHLVTRLEVIAPEIIVDEKGNEYISKIHDPEKGYGIQLARLRWDIEK